MQRLVDQYPWLKPFVERFAAGMAADSQFSQRYHRREIELDGQAVPRSPQTVSRVKQAKLLTGRIGYLGRIATIPTTSFIGGQPDSTASFDWPTWQGSDLTFLAQIDLADLQDGDPPEWLPSSGKLLFFVGQAEGEYAPWISRVIHVPDSGQTEPSGQEAFKRRYLSFERHVTYAPLGPEDDTGQVDDNDEVRNWWHGLFPPSDLTLWRVGGWPTPLQTDDMRQECERISRGLAWEDHEAQRQTGFQEAMTTWHLVGQFDLEDIVGRVSGFMRGFYWVKVDSGKAMFDQARLVGQSD